MNDTPRTNEQAIDVWNEGCGNCEEDNPHGKYVYASFARELERENAELRKQADYSHRLICDWWKPQTTSQEVHRQYALSALANA